MSRVIVDPSVMPTQVSLFSIPALDAGAPETVASEEIDSHKLRLRGGEVLISRLNPRKPRVHLVAEGLNGYGVASTEFVALVPTRADPRFLRYFLLTESVRQHLDSQVRSATRSHQRVEPGTITALSVPEIGVEDQRQIADFLDDRVSRIDRIIAARREQVAEVRAHSRGRIVAAVFHSDDVMVPARSLTEIRLGRQRSPTHESGDHMLPYLRSANIADGEVLLADVKTMNFNPAEQRTFSLKPGDVLMTEGSASPGAVGASAVWQANLPGVVCFQNTLLRLRAREMTSQEFVQWWARASHAAGAPRNWASGASILHLGADGLSRMPMPRLSIEEQNQRASEGASAAEEGQRLAKALERSIELFAEYKSSLITAAVTGELDVSTAGSSIPG